MTDTTTAAPENVVLADRADRILEVLRRRDSTEADAQACSMVMAGLRMLQDMRGTAATLDILGRIGPALVGHDDAIPTPTDLAPRVPEDLAGVALGHLRALPLDVGQAQARAAIAASAAHLRETAGDAAALDTLAGVSDALREAAQAAPAPAPQRHNPDDVALSLLDGLRRTAPDEAHEQARAAIAGAAAFLIEARGPVYTSAVVDGLMANATRHIETWGLSPRPNGATLH